MHMEAFFVSTGVVALGEMGDKTQLLAMLLAARFRKPWPIIAGIFVATRCQPRRRRCRGRLGGRSALGPDVLRWVIGLGFLAMAAWMLIPDKIDGDEVLKQPARWGVFGTTFIAFFLAEMGDKTQIATVALAARYPDLLAVVLGTTLGMMISNVPAVFLGDAIAKRVKMALVHGIAALDLRSAGGADAVQRRPVFLIRCHRPAATLRAVRREPPACRLCKQGRRRRSRRRESRPRTLRQKD